MLSPSGDFKTTATQTFQNKNKCKPDSNDQLNHIENGQQRALKNCSSRMERFSEHKPPYEERQLKRNEHCRKRQAAESKEEKEIRLSKRRVQKENQKKKRYHSFNSDLHSVKKLLKSMAGITVLFCLLCLKFNYKENFKEVLPNSEHLIEIKEFIPDWDSSSVLHICEPCLCTLKKGKLPSNCRFNRLDAGAIPSVMEEIKFMEKRFLSQIHVFMTVVTLPSGGQYGQDGLCINFPADIENLYEQLDLGGTKGVVVVRRSASSTENQFAAIVTENLARKAVVSNCLAWLKKNNKHYNHITVFVESLSHEANDPAFSC